MPAPRRHPHHRRNANLLIGIRALTCATLLAAQLPLNTLAATPNTYIGPDQGLWSVATNWSLHAVPDAGQSVSLTDPSAPSVTLDYSPQLGSLTIGSSHTLAGRSGFSLTLGASSIFNLGQIHVLDTGTNLAIDAPTFTNQGVILVDPDTTLTIAQDVISNSHPLSFQPPWTNNGQLNADHAALYLPAPSPASTGTLSITNSTISLIGSLTLASIQLFPQSTNIISVDQLPVQVTILDLAGGTLNLSAVPCQLRGGTIRNGTITGDQSSPFIVATSSTSTAPYLINMALECPTAVEGATLKVQQNLHVDGTLSLRGSSAAAAMLFDPSSGAQILSGNAEIVFDGAGFTDTLGSQMLSYGLNLTIAPSVTIRTGTASGTIQTNSTLTIQGAVLCQSPGLSVNFVVGFLYLQGIIEAKNGGSVQIGAFAGSNSGTLTANGGMISINENNQTLGGTIQALNSGTLTFPSGTINVTSPINLSNASLIFDASSASIASVTGTGLIVIGATSALTSDATIANSLTINGTHTLRVNSTIGASKTSLLLIANDTTNGYTGKLDLTTNKLILQSNNSADKASKTSQLTAAIKSGSNAGTWTGKGLTSSTAAADPQHYAVALFDNAILNLPAFGNQPADANSLLMTIAHLGDANADGIIDIQDQSLVTNNWQKPATTWSTGDLNLDGFVDIQDLTLVTNNWQQQSSFSQNSGLTPQDSGPAPIPEPLTLPLLLTPLLLAVRRKHPRKPTTP